MPIKGRRHFDTYTEQNRVKHAILMKYLDAYLRALSRVVDAFHYIDGFAGPGEYESEHAGSPLYALNLLAEQARPATASFVENDPALFARLDQLVGTAPASRKRRCSMAKGGRVR
jgi:three-Cys-motif partner protein